MNVSIAMATYNGEQWLREQLDSLARQTLLPSELVISDDQSTDGTLEVVRQFASASPFPIRVVKNELRRGFADNFIHALRSCDRNAVAYCDQDDVWNPAKLERCVAAMQRDPGITLVHHDCEEVGDDLRPLGIILRTRSSLSGAEPMTRHRIILHPGQGCSMLFHRRVVEAVLNYWPERNQRNVVGSGLRGDLAHDIVTLHLASFLGKVIYLPDLLIKHRRHSRNTWSPELPTPSRSRAAEFDGRVATLMENARAELVRASMYEEMAERAKATGDPAAACYLARIAERNLKSARFFSVRGDLYNARSVAARLARFSGMLRTGSYGNLGGKFESGRCAFKDLAFALAGPIAARFLEKLRKQLHLDFDPRELFESENRQRTG
jgi:glycosyltransferase involved in cell wall biosynthesis